MWKHKHSNGETAGKWCFSSAIQQKNLSFSTNLDIMTRLWLFMSGTIATGRETMEALAGKDLNNDGKVIHLIVCGNSKFYDYSFFEDEMNMWCKYNGYPDVVILGGASGVDYLAERWADNNNIAVAVFREAWSTPRPNRPEDSGREEAVADLGERMMEHATHMLAFPGPQSVWTKRMETMANEAGLPVMSVTLPMD